MKKLLVGLLFLALAGAVPDEAGACEVKIIITFSPGASSDQVARVVKDDMGNRLGCTVIIENVPGEGGILGARRFIEAGRRDGSLLLGLATSGAAGVVLKAPRPYDPRTAFAAIGQWSGSCVLLATGNESGFRNVPELLTGARERPGKFNSGVANNTTFVAGAEFLQRTGISVQEVWYKNEYQLFEGLSPAGGLQYGILTCAVGRQWFENRQLRALATLTKGRHPDFPGVPAITEFGINATSVTPMSGLVALAGTPEPVLAKLRFALDEALAKRKDDIIRANLTYVRKPWEEFRDSIAEEYTAWERIVRETNLSSR